MLGVANFADIFKIATTFIKTQTIKTQKKLKQLQIMYLKSIYICIS